MKLLAVDTATEACSAALLIDGVVTERFHLTQREHSALILPMIDGLLAEAGLKPCDLDCLAFGCGPGSFTGLRIAAGVIQGIALGADLPVVPVSTLAALAQDYFDAGVQAGTVRNEIAAFTAIDARMGEIYWAVYRQDGIGYAELLGIEWVGPAAQVESPDIAGVGLGSGWGAYKADLKTRLDGWVDHIADDKLPRAGAIARLGVRGYKRGLAVDAANAQPVYLRDNVAKKESER